MNTFYLPTLNSDFNCAYSTRFQRGIFALFDKRTGAFSDYFFADDDFSAMRAVMSSNLRNHELSVITKSGASDLVLCRVANIVPDSVCGINHQYFSNDIFVDCASSEEASNRIQSLDPLANVNTVRIAYVSELLAYVGLMSKVLDEAKRA